MNRFSRSLTLKTKLFATFASVSVLIIIICGVAIYISSLNEIKNQTQSMSKVLSTQFSRTIDLYFKDIERLSLALFTDAYIQETLGGYEDQGLYNDISIKNKIYPRLFNQLYPRSKIEGIAIYTNTGTVFDYENSGDIEVRYEKAEKNWMTSLDKLDKSSFLLLPTQEESLINGTNEQVVSLVRHIYEIPQREKIGSVKIDINIKAFEQMLEIENVEHLEKYIRILVVSENKDVVYDDKNLLIGESLTEINTSKFEEWEQKEGTLRLNDESYLYTNDHSNFTNWNAVILINNKLIDSERNQMLMFIGLSALIVTVLIGVISYLLSHNITKPLVMMMERMKRVEEGDLADRMELTGNTEVDVLTRVYNRMLDSISELIKEVYESSIAEKNAKISALQSQINPHFLYNTLNVMKSISRVKGIEEVAEISESLADLFKYTMKDLDKKVTLFDEIQHIENYIRIQQHRFMGRFQLVKEIEGEATKVIIPKLLIQPLIENAVVHGLAKKKKEGLVTFKAFKQKENLIIEVMDNGNGISEENLIKVKENVKRRNLNPKEDGVGLNNITQRIRLMYGYRYGIEVESEKNKGTIIRVTIPYQTASK